MTATTPTEFGTRAEAPSLWSRLTDRWLVKLLIIVIVIVWVIPTLGVLISSFRPAGDVNANGWWTVFANLGSTDWTFENYSTVLSSEGFGNAFLNSLSVTIPATVIPITIAAFAAYAFAWMDFPGRQWIFVAVVVLGAAAMGVHNVLCLTGDHQTFGSQPDALNVFDIDSIDKYLPAIDIIKAR